MQNNNATSSLMAIATFQNIKSRIQAFKSHPMDELNDLNPSFLLQMEYLYKELDDLEKNIHKYSSPSFHMRSREIILKCEIFAVNCTEILDILTQNIEKQLVFSKKLLQKMHRQKDINDANPQLLERVKELDLKLKKIINQPDLTFETLKKEFFGPLQNLRYDYAKASSSSFKTNIQFEAMKEKNFSSLQNLDRDYTKASSQSFTKFIKKQQRNQGRER